jgi:hypothetical protein
MQVCAIVCACCARALLLACPDGHMEDGNDSLSLQVFFDGIEQDQSSVTSYLGRMIFDVDHVAIALTGERFLEVIGESVNFQCRVPDSQFKFSTIGKNNFLIGKPWPASDV